MKEASANPGFLVGEGLDKAGVFTLPFEAANSIGAMAGGRASVASTRSRARSPPRGRAGSRRQKTSTAQPTRWLAC